MILNTAVQASTNQRQFASKPDSSHGSTSNSGTARSAPSASAPTGSAETTPDIQQLNDDIRNLEKRGSRNIAPERKSLYEQRDTAITQLTGNKNTGSYDTRLAAVSQQQGITYNKAVENENRTAAAFNSSERATPVEELPWETPAVRERVDDLMANDGLSFDAAVVIAMTGRTANGSTAPEIDAEWRPQFAEMVANSGDEIEQWATSQTADAVTFVPGDNDISVTMENGMIVVRSSLNGVPQGDPQIIDPNSTERIVINAGDGNDTITIDPSVTQDLVVVGGDGDDFIYGGGGDEILIGGDGDDLVRGNDGADIVIGGNGDDNMEGGAGGDLMFGNAGADYMSGGDGNDITWGGQGRDTAYGGNGDDILQGEGGDDYMDGGSNDDLLIGADGNDTMSGGKDDDELIGGEGADMQIGASGADVYTGAEAEDVIITDSPEFTSIAQVRVVEHDATAGAEAISMAEGSRAEFVTRVEDDLETLRSLETGQQMLNSLDQAATDSTVTIDLPVTGNVVVDDGNRVVMEELDGRDEIALIRNPALRNPDGSQVLSTENGFAVPGSYDWRNGESGDMTILYNPSVNLDLATSGATPPVVILFHEMVHGYNMVTGTGLDGTHNVIDATDLGVNNTELQAVGLTLDHDGDPATPEQLVSGHPYSLTENGLRTELNLELRPTYRTPPPETGP